MRDQVYIERPEACDSVVWTVEKLLRMLENVYEFRIPEPERSMLERTANVRILFESIKNWMRHREARPPKITLRVWAERVPKTPLH